MDETLIGTVPNRPMSNIQKRAHRRLASAEKALIRHLIWDEGDVVTIAQAEALVVKRTVEWKKVCA
jgi:hypothetical protein